MSESDEPRPGDLSWGAGPTAPLSAAAPEPERPLDAMPTNPDCDEREASPPWNGAPFLAGTLATPATEPSSPVSATEPPSLATAATEPSSLAPATEPPSPVPAAHPAGSRRRRRHRLGVPPGLLQAADIPEDAEGRVIFHVLAPPPDTDAAEPLPAAMAEAEPGPLEEALTRAAMGPLRLFLRGGVAGWAPVVLLGLIFLAVFLVGMRVAR